ncbi:MAG TPA: NUDIX domain-containing protein [Streptosporangiaceae bacterium]|jgi:ADP-ribose pyrophosphatase YjhB (NUDIX family)
MDGTRRVPCVGAVMFDAAGRLLLILRRNEPGAGLWSIPGGRIEAGESDELALVREVAEETGLAVRCGALLGAVERPGLPPGTVVDIRDYAAVITGGELAAGDDAAAARWASPAEIADLEAAGQLTPGLVAALRSWQVL